MDVYLVLSLGVTIAVLLFSIVFFFCKIHGKEGKNTKMFLLFIDAPDPDNPAVAAAIIKHVFPLESTPSHLHIILTGRPVDLKTPKTTSRLLSDTAITRQDWEGSVLLHAQKTLEDSAERLTVYLKNCGIDIKEEVTIYNGGVAPTAPLSDVVHDWDFLFDRKDLITGHEEDRGRILSPKEYDGLVDRYSSLPANNREHQLLSVLRPYHLTPLSVLAEEIQNNVACDEVIIFLGGPATAIVQLFKQSDFCHKVVSLYGMFGSLSPGKTTLLKNQFNIACDINGACDLFIDNLFPYADKYLITTETAKNSVVVLESADIHTNMNVPEYFYQLHRLWEHTHDDRVQPLFDVVPVLAYLKEYKDSFSWNRKKAVLYEWRQKKHRSDQDGCQSVPSDYKKCLQQQFAFIDSEETKHPLLSDDIIKDFQKQDFVEFMTRTWT